MFQIRCVDIDLRRLEAGLIANLRQALMSSDPPILLRFGQEVVYLLDGRRVTPDELSDAILCRHWLEVTNPAGEPVDVVSSPTKAGLNVMLRDFLLAGGADLPSLDSIVSHPQVAPWDGKLRLIDKGINHALRTYMIKRRAALPDASPDYPHLRAWLSGLHYVSPDHQGRALGWAVALLARAYCGAFPHLLITSRHKSCCKTRLASGITYFLTGNKAPPLVSYTGNEQEMEMRFGSLDGFDAPACLILDNVRAKQRMTSEVRSMWLSTAATIPTSWVRVMYKGMRPVSYPTVILTGVDSSVEADLNDKVWPVLLTKPSGVQSFYAEPDPLKYAHEHRLELLSEAVHLLSTLDLTCSQRTRFPQFENIVTGVCSTLSLPFSTDVDTTDSQVRELYNVLQDSGAPMPFTEIVKMVERSDNIRELSQLLFNSRQPTERSKAAYLRSWVQEHLAGRSFQIDGKSFTFTLDKDSAGVYTLELK